MLLLSSFGCCKYNKSMTVTIFAHYPKYKLNDNDCLYIRGNGLSLNWDNGALMNNLMFANINDSNIWVFEIQTNITQTMKQYYLFECKILINDRIWMIGANAMFNLSIYNHSNFYELNLYPWFYNYRGTLQNKTKTIVPTFLYISNF